MHTKLLLGTVATIALLGTSVAAQDTDSALENTGEALGNAADSAGDALGNAADATGDAIGNAADATGDAIGSVGERIEMPNDGRYTMQMDDAGQPVLGDDGQPIVLRADGSRASPDEYRVDESGEIMMLVLAQDAGGEVDEQGRRVTTRRTQATQGGEFVVEQAQPTVNVDVPDPVIEVDQATPEVTVEQPQPEITVRQSPPTVNVEQQAPVVTVQQQQPVVTVRIPEPVVTIRMPQPEVQVSQDQPDVQVETPQPVVRFIRPEPQIRVEQAEAQVNVSQAQPEVDINRATQADVQIEQSQPQVQVEEAGEPQVNVTEAEPQVQVQQAEGADVQVEQTGEPQIDVQREGEPDPAAVQDLTTQGFIVDPTATETDEQRTARVEGYAPFAETRTDDLIGMNVLAADGEDVGEIDNVATMGDRLMLVVGVGGFLGLGERNVAIPLERFAMEGDNLVITGLNSDQIQNLPEYDEASAEYLPTDARIGDYGTD